MDDEPTIRGLSTDTIRRHFGAGQGHATVIARSSPRVCAALFQPPSSIPHWLDTTYVDGVLTALLLGKTDRLDVIVEGLKP